MMLISVPLLDLSFEGRLKRKGRKVFAKGAKTCYGSKGWMAFRRKIIEADPKLKTVASKINIRLELLPQTQNLNITPS
jgi:hypothetical protein